MKMQTIRKLSKLLLISFSIILFSGSLISETFAQTRLAAKDCVPMAKKDKLLNALSAKYNEKQIFVAVSDKGHMITVYVNVETGTWTILGVSPTNYLCILDTGSGAIVTPENVVLGTET
jgi:hypothetical protein|tara:strand:- start:805 stop:1161 length:357 start_codon:yes stop_codon:yes gene_type:complete